MALVLLIAMVTPAVAVYDPVTDGDVDPIANPQFPQLCGVNVILLIDNSASLNQGNLSDVKAAANATVDALAATGSTSGVGIISFNQPLDGSDGADTRIAITPLDSASNVSAVKGAIGGIQLPASETLTNWEAAFLEASQAENDGDGDVADENLYKPADVVVIITDGRPNAYGYNGNFAATGFTDAREAATDAANVVKGEGTRVVGVGFPDSNGNVPVATPFEAITDGAASVDDTESSDAQEIDYYLADSSAQVNSILLGIADEVDCGIALEKLNDANVDSTFTDDETAPAPGDAVTYQVNVTNTGKIDLVVDSYADDQYGVPVVSPGLVGETLAAGSSRIVTFQGVAPEENGVKVNVFNVTASDADGNELEAEDDATVRSPDLTPSISVEKQNDANADGTYSDDETSAQPGDAVTYLVTVTNDGPNAVTIDSFGDDVYTGLADGDLNQSLVGVSLTPGESIAVTFVGSSPADEDESKVNTFDVSASDADGDEAADEDDTTVRSPDLTPSISVEKQNDANADGTFSDDETSTLPGDAVTYQVTVTNDGPNAVTIDSFDDDVYTGLADGDFNQSLVGVSLAPGESVAVTFVGSSPVDEDQSKVNVFNVTGSDADGDVVSDEDDTTVRSPDLTPSLDVQKQNDANADGTYSDDETSSQPGDAVTYLVTVTNDGPNNVTLDGYSDDVYGAPTLNQSLVGVSLAPGESIAVTFVGSSPAAEDESKVNVFNVTGSDADGDGVSDEDDTTVRSPDLTPSISVEKQNDANADGAYSDDETSSQPGDAVTYLVTVTNDGPNAVTIDSFGDDIYTALADGDLNQSLVGETLAPGESIAVTFVGSSPAAEDEAKINTFDVSASDADGDDVSDEDDTTVRSPDLTPSISVEKQNDANADGTYSDDETSAQPGDAVTYLVTVTNDGPNNVTIDSFGDDVYTALADGDLNQSLVGVSLAPGESVAVTFVGSSPAAEDQSKVNTFDVSASDADGDEAADEDDTTVRSPDITPSITVEKLVDGDDADATFEDAEFANQSSAATYQVTVTNDGPNDVSLTSFSDDVYTGLADGDLNQSLVGVSLAPGESVAVTFGGSAPDLEGDSKVNTFTVNAVDGDGDPASDSDDASITAYDLTPSITVEKLVDAQGDGTFADSEEATNPSDDVTYMVIIENDGPNAVTFDSYGDDVYGVPTLNQQLVGVSLAPGESITVTFDGTAPTVYDGSKTNVFTATASDENGDEASDDDDATVTTPPALDICPRTPGFWSTHNGEYATGNNLDHTTALLPIALGDGTGESVLVDSDDVANAIFETQLTSESAKNNGVSKLYIHLLAAKLNTANGAAAPQEVLEAIERSDEILTDYDESDWDDLRKNDRELAGEILDLKDVLDDYNNRVYTGDGCVEDWWQEEIAA